MAHTGGTVYHTKKALRLLYSPTPAPLSTIVQITDGTHWLHSVSHKRSVAPAIQSHTSTIDQHCPTPSLLSWPLPVAPAIHCCHYHLKASQSISDHLNHLKFPCMPAFSPFTSTSVNLPHPPSPAHPCWPWHPTTVLSPAGTGTDATPRSTRLCPLETACWPADVLPVFYVCM